MVDDAEKAQHNPSKLELCSDTDLGYVAFDLSGHISGFDPIAVSNCYWALQAELRSINGCEDKDAV
jgi:hypothetical protein